jgi:hypothetical protein
MSVTAWLIDARSGYVSRSFRKGDFFTQEQFLGVQFFGVRRQRRRFGLPSMKLQSISQNPAKAVSLPPHSKMAASQWLLSAPKHHAGDRGRPCLRAIRLKCHKEMK